MIRRIATLLALPLMLMIWVLLTVGTPTSHRVTNAPKPVPSAPVYPACVTEDGAGQALCMWDAQTQGNGQGTSVVSGDCAPSVVDVDSVALCVMLHSKPSMEIMGQDGSINTVPNGADLVAECTDEFDAGIAQNECMNAWLNG